jgi:hypothetical protein
MRQRRSGSADVGVLEQRNLLAGTINGTVFDDRNASGLRDAGEAGRVSVVVYVDANRNGKLDGSEIRSTTDGRGNYTLRNVPAGSALVRAFPLSSRPQDVVLTSTRNNGGLVVNVRNDAVATAPALGLAMRTASITMWVFSDRDADGQRDFPTDSGLSGRVFYIDRNNNGRFDSGELQSTPSQSTGKFTFANLLPGTYRVRALAPLAGGQFYTNAGGAVVTLTLRGGEQNQAGRFLIASR